jgi:hypothetical protein
MFVYPLIEYALLAEEKAQWIAHCAKKFLRQGGRNDIALLAK